jgi:peptidoglycan/LPS O-acetylase OafA/YrhL
MPARDRRAGQALRSSSGAHFIALDHVRALAAFMVFTWHFTHASLGYPVPFGYVPSLFVFSLLDEGHTGVALFMTLSGYLFAKLLEGRRIDYGAFFWNRFLRLAPLLGVVILLAGLRWVHAGLDPYQYAASIAAGVLFPSLPNGGWSITVEFHFYLLLPLLLWLSRKSRLWLLAIILAALALRLLLHHERGEVQSLAFWTIVGRLDQFLLGMLAFQYRALIARRHVLVIGSALAFALFYWRFDIQGGFYLNPSYPSPSPIWIVLPALEGLTYALAISYYDNSFRPADQGVSRFIGNLGAYSYSIYLFHFFVVFAMAAFVHERVMPISNFYLACLWSAVCFLVMMPIGYLSFRFIEAPFLKLRRPYAMDPAILAR